MNPLTPITHIMPLLARLVVETDQTSVIVWDPP